MIARNRRHRIWKHAVFIPEFGISRRMLPATEARLDAGVRIGNHPITAMSAIPCDYGDLC